MRHPTPFHAENTPGADSHRVLVQQTAGWGGVVVVSSPDRCVSGWQMDARGPTCGADFAYAVDFGGQS